MGAMGLGKQRGAVFILYLNKDGTVKKSTQISSMQGMQSLMSLVPHPPEAPPSCGCMATGLLTRV